MNIVYFLTFGYSLKTWDESSALERESKYFNYLSENYGYKFYIVTYGDQEDLNFKGSFLNAEIIPIYKYFKKSRIKIFNLIFSIFYPYKLKKIIDEKITITKQNQLLGTWVSYGYKKLTNSKLFVRTGYDMYLFSIKNNKSILKKYLYKQLTQYALKVSDIYTVSSKSDFDFLNKTFKNKHYSELFLLPNWIDIKYNEVFKERKNIILSVGRLEYQKNYEYLIKELSGTNLEIVIFGQGSEKDKLLKLANKLGTKLEIIEKIDNNKLLDTLSKTKYFVLPSIFEGNPKALLEAMGAGCIVFASKIPNHLEIIKHYEDGVLFEIKEKLLREQIENVILKREFTEDELQDMSSKASKNVNLKFSISKIASKENQLINSLNNE